jgi:sortase A
MAPRFPRSGRLSVAIVLLAAAALGAVLATGVLAPPSPGGPVPLPNGSPSETTLATPGSEAPSSSGASKLAASPSPLPVGSPSPGPGVVATGIAIPALGIDLPVYQGDGYTAELGKVAHYPTSAWPHAGSLIYLYAHAREHNFLALWNAKIGEQVNLRLADGSTATYVISRIDAKVRWDDLSWLDPTPTEVLRLQTCNSYQETAPRFIVEARPVPEANPTPNPTVAP